MGNQNMEGREKVLYCNDVAITCNFTDLTKKEVWLIITDVPMDCVTLPMMIKKNIHFPHRRKEEQDIPGSDRAV